MVDDKSKIIICVRLAGAIAILLSTSACAPMLRMTGRQPKAGCIGAGVTSVSASTDSDSFVISYCDNRKSLIAVREYFSDNLKIVLESDTSLYQRPIILNQDGDIAFIERSTVDQSAIKTIDKSGSVSRLTDDRPESKDIRDMALSPIENKIYYVNSRSYRRSSPVGPYLPHDNDFYLLRIGDKVIQRLSFSDEYHLPGISVSRDGKTILSRANVLEPGDSKIKNINYKVDERLAFTSDQLTHTSQFPISQVSVQNQMILACGKGTPTKTLQLGDTQEVKGFGLFVIQLPEKVVSRELIYLKSYLSSPTILEKEGVVLFIRQPYEEPLFRKSKRELWSIKLDGSDLKRIPLTGIE